MIPEEIKKPTKRNTFKYNLKKYHLQKIFSFANDFDTIIIIITINIVIIFIIINPLNASFALI